MPGKQAKILSTNHIDDLLFFADNSRSPSATGLSFCYQLRRRDACQSDPSRYRSARILERMMARPVEIRHGVWPLEMRSETAAAYCDEPSVDAFLSKVARGIYPQASRQAGCLPKWHRAKLDAAVARRHGLEINSSEIVEDATALL
jgi:hypothetical protein